MASETFTTTTDWTVPDQVQEVTIECLGAEGGDAENADGMWGGNGGAGGRAYAEQIPVTPGETLYIRFPDGGHGATADSSFGSDGADGGAAADVRQGGTSGGDIIIIAGGGGGGGGANAGSFDADGGDGGDGGGLQGADGEPGEDSDSEGGAGGTQSSGYFDRPYGQGADIGHAGGGGAGYHGGEVGAVGGGGGGGSGYIGPGSNTTLEVGDNYGGAEVTITYSEPPEGPENVEQTVEGDDQIEVDADENPDGGNYDEFRIEVSEDGGSYDYVAAPSSMPFTYNATESVDEHQFRVRGENSVGESNWSYTTTKSTDITSVTASSPGDSSFAVSWDAADDANGYDVLTAADSGSSEDDYSVVAPASSSPTTVEGMENGERYYVRVIARYPNADSLSTVEDEVVTTLPAPTLDSLDTSTDREVTVSYTLNDNSSDGDVTIEYSTDGGVSWQEAGTVSDLSQESFTHTGLLDGEEYAYRVVRATPHAETTSGTGSGITNLPAPLDLTVSNVTVTSADYSWTPQHNNGETLVQYRPTDTSEWQTAATVGHNVTQEAVDALRNLEEYDARVVASTEHTQTEDQ